ncbi:MAG: Ig-like domain-containing protein [Bacteroidota bacterium]
MKRSLLLLVIATLIALPFGQLKAQQLMNLDPPTGSRFTVTDKVWPANHGQADVCLWQDDKLSAFTVTIDDNPEADIPSWETHASNYGYNFTWFVITQAASGNVSDWSNFTALKSAGHAVEGHDDRNWANNITTQTTYLNSVYTNDAAYTDIITLSPNFVMYEGASAGMTYSVDAAYPTVTLSGVPSFGTATENGLTGSIDFAPTTDDQGVYYISVIASDGTNEIRKDFRLGVNTTELEYYNRLLATKNDIDGQISADICRTYAYPYGEGEEAEARKLYTAMRGTNGILNQASEINYLNVNSVTSSAPTGNPANYIDPLMDETSTLWGVNYYRGWGSTHFHSIGSQNVVGLLDYIQARDIWVGTFPEVAAYGQSRDSHTLNVTSVTESEVQFDLTDQMNDTYFDFPLTVKIRVNNTWTAVSATQNGSAVDAQLITEGTDNYVLVKAVPDVGTTTVTGTITAGTNNAPVLAAIGNQTVTEAETLNVNITATDADATDVLTISATNLPSFATLTDNGDGTATLSIAPNSGDAGTYNNISVSVNDGTDSHSEGIVITVNEGNGVVILSSAADGMVNDASLSTVNNPYTADVTYDTGVGMKLGQSDNGGGNVVISNILVFELPERPAGEVVLEGDVTVDINWKRQWVTGSFDLYGLPYSSSSAISADMHYNGAFLADQSGNTGLQDAFWAAPAGGAITSPGAISSSADASALIAAYINAQYDAGAVAGDFVFIRISPAEDYVENGNFIFTSSGDSGDDAIKPKLAITFGEPVTNTDVVILSSAADGMVNDASLSTVNNPYTADVTYDTGVGMKLGQSDNGGGNVVISNILVFELPERPAGEVVLEGDVTVDINWKRQWVTGSFDLYGLPYSSSSAISADMHYNGAFLADQSGNTGLQDAFWAAPAGGAITSPGAISSSADASALIAAYINAQYDAGAVAGDFVFIRISPAEDYVENGNFIFTSSGDSGDDAIKPKLSITFGESGTSSVPVLAPIGDQTATEGVAKSVAVSAVDTDGDALSFSISGNPTGVTLTDNNDGTASIEISDAVAVGTHNDIVITVSDGTGTDTETISITVNASNTAPVLETIGDQTTTEVATANISILATDPEGDALVFTANNLPTFATLTDNGDGTANLVLEPVFGHAGTYPDVVIIVSDGTFTDSDTISITVNPAAANKVPVLVTVGNQTVNEGETKNVNIYATDIDGDDLTISASNLPVFATLTDNGNGTAVLALTPQSGDKGTYNEVVITVNDGEDTDEETISITVDVNTGIEVITTNKVQVYPNPAQSGQFSIALDGFEGKTDISILNLQGKVLIKKQIFGAEKVYKPVINLVHGPYIIRIENSGNTVYKKLIVE